MLNAGGRYTKHKLIYILKIREKMYYNTLLEKENTILKVPGKL